MSRAKLIDGKAFAEGLRTRVAELAATFTAQTGRKAGLAVVLVGEDPASQVYVRSKGKQTLACGMASFEHKLPADTAQQDLVALVERLNADPAVDGILVQLPLPGHLDEQAVVETIDPAKDVDGLTPVSTGRLALGLPGLVPCTPLGSLMLLKDRLGDLSGLEAVVIGRSILVGKPMAQLLLRENCTVTVAHSRTRDLPAVVRRADIVVAAVGRREMVKADWIKPGATVINVGINRISTEDGKSRLVGDVDCAGVAAVAGAITPVPGGVGPMTIAVLLRNTLVAAYDHEGLPLAADPDLMRQWRPALAIGLALAATPATARRPAPALFAEPGDIIAAEGSFTHLSATKGAKAAIRATAAPDAEIFAPQLMRVTDYANRTADPTLAIQWHTGQVWMSCDGSFAVTHGEWQRPPTTGWPTTGWYITIWHRQKGGGYKWVLEQGGALRTPLPASDMISASVADCPVRHAGASANRKDAATPPAQVPVPDYVSGHADDGTLEWNTSLAADGLRTFTLRVKQDGVMHEVLRATATPPSAR